MKQLVCYQCELCRRLYESEEEAAACEKKGASEPLTQKGEEINIQLTRYFHRHSNKRAIVLNVQQVGHDWEYQLGILMKRTKSVESIHIYSSDELRERLISSK
ncbi:hypothetical protein CN918_25380 [Priestia megaterium]|nr:hypothetical protein CN918_25380 [Priestia megaterium]